MGAISILAKQEQTGHELLDGLIASVDSYADAAVARDADVQARLAALEAEAKSLHEVRVRSDAVRAAVGS